MLQNDPVPDPEANWLDDMQVAAEPAQHGEVSGIRSRETAPENSSLSESSFSEANKSHEVHSTRHGYDKLFIYSALMAVLSGGCLLGLLKFRSKRKATK